MAGKAEEARVLGVVPVPVDRPGVIAFRLVGRLARADMAFMAAVANRAFDRHEVMDMLLIFEPEAEIALSALAGGSAIRAEVRALGKVGRYVTVGAPAAAKVMIEALDPLLPPDAHTFSRDAEAEAWQVVQARPLPPPDGVSLEEWEAMAAVNAHAHRAAAEAGRAGIAAGVLQGGRLIALEANEVALQCDPTRHAEGVAMAAAARLRGGPDLSGCVLVSSLQPCEMCLAASRFAGIDRILFAARKARVPGKYFVFPGLSAEDFQRAAAHPFTLIGGLQEDDVLGLYADGAE